MLDEDEGGPVVGHGTGQPGAAEPIEGVDIHIPQTPMAGPPTDSEDARAVARVVMNASRRQEASDRAVRPGDQSEDDVELPSPIQGRLTEEQTSMLARMFARPNMLDDLAETLRRVTEMPEDPEDPIDLAGDDQMNRDAAASYLESIGLSPTPDAIEQLDKVFRPCLTIMCDRGWDPEGGTWRQAGRLGALADVRKKFMRLWERAWRGGKRHDDSAVDLINYVGFYMRADMERWGDWGEPG